MASEECEPWPRIGPRAAAPQNSPLDHPDALCREAMHVFLNIGDEAEAAVASP
jgi:hypothetical protein